MLLFFHTLPPLLVAGIEFLLHLQTETMAVMLLCLVHVLSHPLLPAGPTSWGRVSKCSQHCPLLRPSRRLRQGRAGQGAAVVVATEQRD